MESMGVNDYIKLFIKIELNIIIYYSSWKTFPQKF
jgi:hypothetical protein